VVDILDGEIEFVFVMLGIATIFRASARSFKRSAAVIGVLRS
jgi:hypothetical protein